ncbi:hydrolase [Rhodococcoides fascians]|uniref:alpha/beta hydrolase family protein n=1 Tax=Rhodococcoides fascians TaxID=1828 RepID=UPI000B9A5B43|nr:alpha/beta fold hydrolase [Rhodococcus fascians]OZE88591.1 hydrolase [Rhodococcus fascians]OZF16552.1 hydrolase [Rhodococcus fascians]OZF19568.1 hydrolase [Rhodococcus fascians]OZF65834.1 hydrolase [Rhodococcus fascians]OZF68985.1 hydrolase [Rhodococcus fascians]
MQTVPIQMPDGSTVPVSLFPSEGRDDAPVIVVLPGLGIPGGYYRLFAEALVARGFHAAIGDLRGQGDSKPKPSSSSRYGYQELVSVDFPAIFEVVREQFPAATPYLLGHSMGGQLGAMYAARIRGRLGGLILVASGSPYHRGFGTTRGVPLYFGAAAMAITSNIAGFWPGDRIGVGGFGRQSRVLIDDWSRFARTGSIEPAGADIDYEERMGRLTLPVLAVTIEGDDLAPKGSMENLTAKLANADITTEHIDEPLGHNGWIRNPTAVADLVERWMQR